MWIRESAGIVGERLGNEMRELLGESLSVDCKVGGSNQIGLESIPALGHQLGPPLGQALRRSTFPRARAHRSSRCFRRLHSLHHDSGPICDTR